MFDTAHSMVVTEEEMRKVLSNVDENKGSTPDGLSPYLSCLVLSFSMNC